MSYWLARGFVEYFISRATQGADPARTSWQKRVACGVLHAMGVTVCVEGPLPKNGILVCNHLGYLDILVLASLFPAVFVAKSEVSRWPVLGWLAQLAGTIFVNRESRSDVIRVAREMKQALQSVPLVVLFPEGTSSSGRSVLPFRSALLAPIISRNLPVSVAALDYQLADGSVEEEVCYWGDMVLGPHLLNLFSKQGIEAKVRFGVPDCQNFTDRKQLALSLHESVTQLRTHPSGTIGF